MKLAVAGVALAASLSGGVAWAGSDDREAPVVEEGRLGETWAAAAGATFPAPGYPARFAGRGDDVCLAVGYAVGRDGTTGDFAVLREWTSAPGETQPQDYWDAFAQAAANAISQWRFAPREGIPPRRTYTVATVAFTGRDAAGVRDNCRIDDLAHELAERQERYVMDYSREKRDLERNARQIRAAAIAATIAAGSRRIEQSHDHSNP